MVPTYSRAKGIFDGTPVKGWVRDGFLQTDTQGWVPLKLIEGLETIYEIHETPDAPGGEGHGIICLSNGMDLSYGPYSQYKTRDEAMALMEAVASLCAGIDISMKEVGRAMQPLDKEIQEDLKAYADYVYKLKSNYFELAKDVWDKLTDSERLSLPRCHSCGSIDTTCQCWNDE